jgi:hypothetical protein
MAVRLGAGQRHRRDARPVTKRPTLALHVQRVGHAAAVAEEDGLPPAR